MGAELPNPAELSADDRALAGQLAIGIGMTVGAWAHGGPSVDPPEMLRRLRLASHAYAIAFDAHQRGLIKAAAAAREHDRRRGDAP